MTPPAEHPRQPSWKRHDSVAAPTRNRTLRVHGCSLAEGVGCVPTLDDPDGRGVRTAGAEGAQIRRWS